MHTVFKKKIACNHSQNLVIVAPVVLEIFKEVFFKGITRIQTLTRTRNIQGSTTTRLYVLFGHSNLTSSKIYQPYPA